MLKSSIAGSLNGLLVLEAAVRCGGFSMAAKTLNLSQPAVSRHIATLEERLGQALFVRDHNKIAPTEAGQKLADAVALGFGHVAAVWQDISTISDEHKVVLACSYGFADQWLMPRFSDLRATMKGTQVRVVTSDRLEDLDFGRVDAAVVWDLSKTPDRPAIPLIRDETFPVCSPEFLAQRQALLGSEASAPLDLSRLPAEDFLHFSVGRSGFQTWHSWFISTGLAMPNFGHPTPYDAYPFLMRAVLNHEGVALGWRGLVDQLLLDGKLVKCGPSAANREISYYLQHKVVQGRGQALGRLIAWFEREAGSVKRAG